jgi:uncharacterized protein (TIRG00374 family)
MFFAACLLLASFIVMRSGGSALYKLFMSLGFRLMALLLLMAPLNYLLRWMKWQMLLMRLEVPASRTTSSLVFLAGLGLAAVPGKMGELAKPLLLRELNGTQVSQSLPAVVVLRYTDVVSVVILALVGSTSFPWASLPLALLLLALLLAGAALRSARLMDLLMTRLPQRLMRQASFLRDCQTGIKKLMTLRVLTPAVLIGILSWTFEGLIVYLALWGLGVNISPLASLFVVSFSTVGAGLSMLPGGIGIAEVSIMALLNSLHVDRDAGALVTLLTRVSTVWMGALVGSCALYILARKMERGS